MFEVIIFFRCSLTCYPLYDIHPSLECMMMSYQHIPSFLEMLSHVDDSFASIRWHLPQLGVLMLFASFRNSLSNLIISHVGDFHVSFHPLQNVVFPMLEETVLFKHPAPVGHVLLVAMC